MFKKIIFLLCLVVLPLLAKADSCTLTLKFPQPANKRVTAPAAMAQRVQVSGSLDLDISPYPDSAGKGRYSVEYYLNGDKLFTTDGSIADSDEMSFKYSLDTTKYEDGDYQITVNFYDNKGKSAIGIKPITIKNKKSDE